MSEPTLSILGYLWWAATLQNKNYWKLYRELQQCFVFPQLQIVQHKRHNWDVKLYTMGQFFLLFCFFIYATPQSSFCSQWDTEAHRITCMERNAMPAPSYFYTQIKTIISPILHSLSTSNKNITWSDHARVITDPIGLRMLQWMSSWLVRNWNLLRTF